MMYQLSILFFVHHSSGQGHQRAVRSSPYRSHGLSWPMAANPAYSESIMAPRGSFDVYSGRYKGHVPAESGDA